MNANQYSVEELLRRQRRWNQYAWPLAVLAAGLGATLAFAWDRHPSVARVATWGHLPQWWLGGLAVTLIAAAVVWRLRHRTVSEAAQAMDEKWAAKNRLETAAALSSAPDAIARAQREETAGFVRQAQVRPRGIPLSYLGWLVMLLICGHLLTLLSWARPFSGGSLLPSASKNPDQTAAQSASAATAPEAKPSAPEASITWNSPEEEIKAAAIEEVPLEAVADSQSGFHDAVLEVSVNGVGHPAVAIELAELKKAGPHTVQTSIYLDQLGVKPYDIVSYDLRAQRNGIQKLPVTVSPVQFVEVKPLREDVHECPPTQEPSTCFNYITAIKSAQLRAMKQNFVLAHTDLSHDSADWKDENKQVGTDQQTLAEKTGEVIDLLASHDAPDEIMSLIRQAKPEMSEAAQKILATQNEPALAPQGKALSLITEVEKYLGRSVRQGPSLVAKVPDPFDKKALELKRRDLTPAGEMEILAREQARLAGDIATTNALTADSGESEPGAISGTPAGRESQISQRFGTLLDSTNFPAETIKHLDLGHHQAEASLTKLNADDMVSAREPAAESARELRLAVEAVRQAAEQAARNELADALRALSDAAGGARITPAQPSDEAARQQASNVVSQVANAARNLTEAARQQQETGSAKAASQLNGLAQALAGTDVQKALQQLQAQPRDQQVAENAANQLQDLADQAGLLQNNGAMTPAELAQLIDRLQRDHVNIQRLIAQNSLPPSPDRPPNGTNGSPNVLTPNTGSFGSEIITDVREGVLEASAAMPQTGIVVPMRNQLHSPPIPGAPSANITAYLAKIDPPLENLITLLQTRLQQQRPFTLTDQQVAEALPAYRPAVADYFEQLSHDYQTPGAADHR
ncbi:MAG: hypothetical protein ABSE16_16090 [Verrucomicrobiota bacterium]|jgi:hypothetical protein